MSRRKYHNLRELRERLLGYRRDSVARLGGIPADRLDAIESGDAPTVYETEVLGRLYGIDPDLLADEPIILRAGDSIETLALLDEFREVPDATKARIVAAANAARDLVALRVMAGETEPWRRFAAETKVLQPPRGRQAPYVAGRRYARQVRKQCGIGTGPIPSTRDLADAAFPSVSVLYAGLGREGVSGLTFADGLRGPTIVLNLDGKNENPCVRRFSLAHELCHVLVDWNRQEPLATLSGFLDEAGLEREQRANGFAARLLCPESRVQRAAKDHPSAQAARTLCDEFGLHYGAARLYLRNVAGVDLPPKPPVELLASATAARWATSEEPAGVAGFPLDDVPPERRTLVARYAAGLYAGGSISRDRFAELLGVTPAHEVDRVLDFFGMGPRQTRT